MLNVGDSKQSAEVYADKALRIAETLAAGDSSNDQARADLVFAYAGMGEKRCNRRSPPKLAYGI
jgi:hypothetical protein